MYAGAFPAAMPLHLYGMAIDSSCWPLAPVRVNLTFQPSHHFMRLLAQADARVMTATVRCNATESLGSAQASLTLYESFAGW